MNNEIDSKKYGGSNENDTVHHPLLGMCRVKDILEAEREGAITAELSPKEWIWRVVLPQFNEYKERKGLRNHQIISQPKETDLPKLETEIDLPF